MKCTRVKKKTPCIWFHEVLYWMFLSPQVSLLLIIRANAVYLACYTRQMILLLLKVLLLIISNPNIEWLDIIIFSFTFLLLVIPTFVYYLRVLTFRHCLPGCRKYFSVFKGRISKHTIAYSNHCIDSPTWFESRKCELVSADNITVEYSKSWWRW